MARHAWCGHRRRHRLYRSFIILILYFFVTKFLHRDKTMTVYQLLGTHSAEDIHDSDIEEGHSRRRRKSANLQGENKKGRTALQPTKELKGVNIYLLLILLLLSISFIVWLAQSDLSTTSQHPRAAQVNKQENVVAQQQDCTLIKSRRHSADFWQASISNGKGTHLNLLFFYRTIIQTLMREQRL